MFSSLCLYDSRNQSPKNVAKLHFDNEYKIMWRILCTCIIFSKYLHAKYRDRFKQSVILSISLRLQ